MGSGGESQNTNRAARPMRLWEQLVLDCAWRCHACRSSFCSCSCGTVLTAAQRGTLSFDYMREVHMWPCFVVEVIAIHEIMGITHLDGCEWVLLCIAFHHGPLREALLRTDVALSMAWRVHIC